MKKSMSLAAMAASCFIFVACNTTTTESGDATEATSADTSSFSVDNERTRINAENAKFMDAIKRGDSAGVAALYTQDALVMPSNYEAVQKDGIASLMGSLIRMGIKEIRLTTDDLTGNKDMIAETGKYEMFADGQKSIDKGKYIVVWKAENGTWKMYRDIFNSNMPAAH
jgi:ketosteroid isomerase-like protein